MHWPACRQNVVYLAGYIFCLQLAALPNISVAVLQLVRHMVKRGKTQPAKIAGADRCESPGPVLPPDKTLSNEMLLKKVKQIYTMPNNNSLGKLRESQDK